MNKLIEALDRIKILTRVKPSKMDINSILYQINEAAIEAQQALQEHAANKEGGKEKTLTEHWGIKTAANKGGWVMVFDVECVGYVKAQFQVTDSGLEVIQAVNGYGEPMMPSEFNITTLPSPPKTQL